MTAGLFPTVGYLFAAFCLIFYRCEAVQATASSSYEYEMDDGDEADTSQPYSSEFSSYEQGDVSDAASVDENNEDFRDDDEEDGDDDDDCAPLKRHLASIKLGCCQGRLYANRQLDTYCYQGTAINKITNRQVWLDDSNSVELAALMVKLFEPTRDELRLLKVKAAPLAPRSLAQVFASLLEAPATSGLFKNLLTETISQPERPNKNQPMQPEKSKQPEQPDQLPKPVRPLPHFKQQMLPWQRPQNRFLPSPVKPVSQPQPQSQQQNNQWQAPVVNSQPQKETVVMVPTANNYYRPAYPQTQYARVYPVQGYYPPETRYQLIQGVRVVYQPVQVLKPIRRVQPVYISGPCTRWPC